MIFFPSKKRDWHRLCREHRRPQRCGAWFPRQALAWLALEDIVPAINLVLEIPKRYLFNIRHYCVVSMYFLPLVVSSSWGRYEQMHRLPRFSLWRISSFASAQRHSVTPGHHPVGNLGHPGQARLDQPDEEGVSPLWHPHPFTLKTRAQKSERKSE